MLISTKRLDLHLSTDKVLYRPGDTVFVSGFIFDAFNHTPVALNPIDTFFTNLEFQMKINDANDK